MHYFLINLDRTPERLQEFKSNNPGFEFERFSAIDGRPEILDGIATKDIQDRYTDGAIGVALSHRELWLKCIELNQPITIIEDDAYLNNRFKEVADKVTDQNDWDLIYWGCNLDQNIHIEILPGVTDAKIEINHHRLVENIENYKNFSNSPSFYRCFFAIGLVCYSITPATATYLLNECFPLHDYNKPYLNFGIDHAVLEELQILRTFITIPPMALTKNDVSKSTVQI